MPPRGRPRKRLMRIDAAIDAMLPLGFTGKQVRKCVKELLKEYGGDDGWPFIEDGSYNELIAALLRDVEKESQEELALDGNQIMQDQDGNQIMQDQDGNQIMQDQDGNQPMQDQDGNQIMQDLDGNQIMQDRNLLKEKSNREEEPAVTDERALDTLQDEVSPQNNVAVAEPVLDETSAHVEEDPPTKVDSPRIKTALPSTKHKKQLPCYGWIEDDDEEEDGNDFITLRPSSMVLGPPKARKYRYDA